MATIVGTSVSETITGTAGADQLTGGAGNDRIEGGDGDDVIVDESGANVIVAGAGNDRITLTIEGITNSGFEVPTANRVDAGDGNDLLTFNGFWFGSLDADMGAGNDIVELGSVIFRTPVSLTLGGGNDRVLFSFDFGNAHRNGLGITVQISDFAAGAGGDSLDLGHFVAGMLSNPSPNTVFPAVNPFASGHLQLVQDGADVIVRYDINGTQDNLNEFYTRDVARLSNVTASQLTAANFASFDPGGAAPLSRTQTGTAAGEVHAADAVATTIDALGGNDILLGGVGADTLRGGDGDDRIDGRVGNDRIEGGLGQDVIEGGNGDDVLIGGDGADVISDSRYGAQIDGGAGDDVITIARRLADGDPDVRGSTVSILAGDGNDRVDIVRRVVFGDSAPRVVYELTATVDLGGGDDVFSLDLRNSKVDLTLGSGRDRIVLTNGGVFGEPQLTVRDFAVGAGGDIIDFYNFMVLFGNNWDRVTNPLESGHMRLVQSGADVLLGFDYDGAGGGGNYSYVARLLNVQIGQLTAANFDGFSPGGGVVAPVALAGTAAGDTMRGTPSADTFSGGDGDDAIEAGGGNDIVNGDGGHDRLSGGHGDDVLRGGAGDDVLEDLGSGSDLLVGGDGNDRIAIRHSYSAVDQTTIIDSGAGDDRVDISSDGSSGRALTLRVDLGAGNDQLFLTSIGNRETTLTLGAGSDRVTLSRNLSIYDLRTVVITDFQTGAGGDTFDAVEMLTAVSYGFPWSTAPVATLGLINPFVTGQARLVQNGADVELRFSEFAAPEGFEQFAQTWLLATFRNTSVANFTAANLGFDPTHVTITGTAGQDALTGTANRDVIRGAEGDDTINGGGGNDLLRGGVGNDVLNGEGGDDYLVGGIGTNQLAGGDGNDILIGGSEDPGLADGGDGNDLIVGSSRSVIRGGAGDDSISVQVATVLGLTGRIDAGDGNDRVIVDIVDSGAFGSSPYAIDLGAGDDVLVTEGYSGLVTLGTGRDRIEFLSGPNRGAIITDFQAGDNGDILDIASLVRENGIPTDPMRALQFGYLEVVQSGANTVINLRLSLDRGFLPVAQVVLQNVQASALTAANFGGFAPNLATSLPAPRQFTASTTLASGSTLDVVNTRPLNDFGNTPVIIGNGSTPVTLTNNGTITTRLTQVGLFDMTGISGRSAAGQPNLFHNSATGVVNVVLDFPAILAANPNDRGESFSTTVGLSGAGLALRNDGMFTVTANYGNAVGVATAPQDTTAALIDNRGTIDVSSGFDATGVIVRGSAQLINTGTIRVHATEFAIGVDGSLNNAGTIIVTTDVTSRFASIGTFVEIGFGPTENIRATNSGTITADLAVWFFDDFPGTNSRSNDSYTNSGTINGAIIMGRGNDVLTNSGTIAGRSLLGEGNDSYDGRTGRHNGSVEGGNGSDTLIGGRFADQLFGENSDDVISAGGGDDYVEGGNGNDMLDGGSGIDVLSYATAVSAISVDLREGMAQSSAERDFVRNFEIFVGSRGADTLLGDDVQETLFGYFGDDVIEGRGGDDILIGGRGNDRLTGGTGLDSFLFDAGDGADTITDFTGGDVIAIFGYSAAQSLTQVGADVRITLSSTDSIVVRGTMVATLTPANLLFTTTAGAVAIPDIPTDTLVGENYFGIGSGAELVLVNPFTPRGGFSAPFLGGVLIDTLANNGLGGGVWNAGSIALSVTQGDDAAYGVRNFSRGTGFDSNYTVYVGSTTARLSVSSSVGDAVGVELFSFWNAGAITVSSSAGDAWGVTGLGSPGPGLPDELRMTNSGMVSVTASGFARGVAQDEFVTRGPDFYANSGTISAHGGTGAIALQVNFAAHPVVVQPVLVNSGTLRATDTVAGDSATALVIQLSAQGRVWNSGTIEGEFAIRITDGTTATEGFSQIVYNSGTIIGRIEGGSYEDRIINTGLVRGNVALGSGVDLFDGRQGRLEGTVDGGDNNDILLTGQGSQSLFGELGDDTLSGGAGGDTLTGGLGRDSFRFESGFGADVVIDFNTGAAHDFIDVAGYTAAQSMVQQGSDVLITFSASDTLLLRNVMLSALTPAMIRFGAAAIAASAIPAAPVALAAPLQPSANLTSSVTFVPLVGTDKADVLRGDLGPDVLRGLEGNDRIEGARGDDLIDGGTGDDQLYGGSGDDLFIVDAAGDIVFELVDQGTDRVEASVGHYLFAEVENLTLVAGAGSIFGVGNELANLIVGNEGANLLIAGAGADVVRGGGGGDALFGQAGKDVLEGEAGVDYLVGGGDADTIGGGNDADALYGEDGDDTLDGGDSFDTDILVGGAGNDSLDANSGQANPDYDLIDGGAGNDSYLVDTGADLTFEGIDGGIDTVYADVPVAGAGVYLYANVENLVLLGSTAFGVGNELANSLTGNASSNFLLGGAGNDIIDGMGGNDVLFGEAGADTFIFARGTGGDVIGDFQRGLDRIDLRAFGFTSFAQLQTSFVQNGDVGAIILGNGDLVVLHGVAMSQLVVADFIL